MSEAKKEKSQQDSDLTETQDQYCEYLCTNGDWFLVGANVEEGYYCPTKPYGHTNPDPDDKGGTLDGYRLRTKPASESNDDEMPEHHYVKHQIPSYYYCEYEYHDLGCGCFEFRIKHANCPAGYYAPAVLTMEDIRRNGIITFPRPIRRFVPGTDTGKWIQT